MSELKQLEMQKDDEMEIDLGEIFHLLMNKLWIIVLCFIIGATLAFGGTKLLITPKYSASSMIYILTKTTSVTSLADIQMGTQLTADFEILAVWRRSNLFYQWTGIETTQKIFRDSGKSSGTESERLYDRRE